MGMFWDTGLNSHSKQRQLRAAPAVALRLMFQPCDDKGHRAAMRIYCARGHEVRPITGFSHGQWLPRFCSEFDMIRHAEFFRCEGDLDLNAAPCDVACFHVFAPQGEEVAAHAATPSLCSLDWNACR